MTTIVESENHFQKSLIMQYQVTKDFDTGETSVQLVSLITTLQQNKIVLDNHYNFMSEIKSYSEPQDDAINPMTLEQAANNRELQQKDGNNTSTNLLLLSKDGTMSIFSQEQEKVISSIEIIQSPQNADENAAKIKHKKKPHYLAQMSQNMLLVVGGPETQIIERIEGSIVNFEQFKLNECSTTALEKLDAAQSGKEQNIIAILFQLSIQGKFYILHQFNLPSMPTHIQVNHRLLAFYMRYNRDKGFKKFFKLYVFDLFEHHVSNLKQLPQDRYVEYRLPNDLKPQTFSSSKRCKSLEFDNKDIILITKTGNDKYFLTRYAPTVNRVYDTDNVDAKELQDQLEKSRYTVAQSVEISSAHNSIKENNCIENQKDDQSMEEKESGKEEESSQSHEKYSDTDSDEQNPNDIAQTVANSIVSVQNTENNVNDAKTSSQTFQAAIQALVDGNDTTKLKSLQNLTGVSGEVNEPKNGDDLHEISCPIMSNNLKPEKTQLMVSAEELEYQFRTCRLFASFVVAGRFDTYLLMQKKQRPLRCVLHGFYQQKQFMEKLAVSGSRGGFVVASISPTRASINLYKNFTFDRQIRLQTGRRTIGQLKDVVIDKSGQLWVLGTQGTLYQLGAVTRMHSAVKVPPLTNFCINRAGSAVIAEEPTGNVYLFEITDDDTAIVSKLVYADNHTSSKSRSLVSYNSVNNNAGDVSQGTAAPNSDTIGVLTHISMSDGKQNADVSTTDAANESVNMISVERPTEPASTKEEKEDQQKYENKTSNSSTSSIKVKPQGATITRFCIQNNGIIDIFWRDNDGLVNTVMMQRAL